MYYPGPVPEDPFAEAMTAWRDGRMEEERIGTLRDSLPLDGGGETRMWWVGDPAQRPPPSAVSDEDDDGARPWDSVSQPGAAAAATASPTGFSLGIGASGADEDPAQMWVTSEELYDFLEAARAATNGRTNIDATGPLTQPLCDIFGRLGRVIDLTARQRYPRRGQRTMRTRDHLEMLLEELGLSQNDLEECIALAGSAEDQLRGALSVRFAAHRRRIGGSVGRP